mmetsp:Transcript_166/g.236  ORF Transcript_166/g.236 Transcript_166/m.236 type:complete len:219 (-) Transcript_166:235-891(-)
MDSGKFIKSDSTLKKRSGDESDGLTNTQKWIVTFPSHQNHHATDDAFASLLNNSSSSVNARLLESKRRAYMFSHKNNIEDKKYKRKKKMLKKMKNLLRRKEKSKHKSDDASLLGIKSVVDQRSSTGSEHQKVSHRVRFPKLRRKNRKGSTNSNEDKENYFDHADCSDEDNGSLISDNLERAMNKLKIDDVHALDFSFSDSEASDNCSSNDACGYVTLS